MSIVYRQELGRELTWSEADNNFAELKAGVDSKKSNFDVLPVTQGGTGQETIDAVRVAFDIATKTELASSAAGKGAELVGNAIQRVTNVAKLRTIAVTTSRDLETQGYWSVGDGGHGRYYGAIGAAPGSYVDNGVTVFVPTGGNGSSAWLLKDNGQINIRQAGAKGDGVTDDSASIMSAINSGSAVHATGGSCVSNNTFVTRGALVFGDAELKTSQQNKHALILTKPSSEPDEYLERGQKVIGLKFGSMPSAVSDDYAGLHVAAGRAPVSALSDFYDTENGVSLTVLDAKFGKRGYGTKDALVIGNYFELTKRFTVQNLQASFSRIIGIASHSDGNNTANGGDVDNPPVNNGGLNSGVRFGGISRGNILSASNIRDKRTAVDVQAGSDLNIISGLYAENTYRDAITVSAGSSPLGQGMVIGDTIIKDAGAVGVTLRNFAHSRFSGLIDRSGVVPSSISKFGVDAISNLATSDEVWRIEFSVGGGIVPAAGTAISAGTAGAVLMFVEDADRKAVAAGAVMPAAGYIVAKTISGDFFAEGTSFTAGITATVVRAYCCDGRHRIDATVRHAGSTAVRLGSNCNLVDLIAEAGAAGAIDISGSHNIVRVVVSDNRNSTHVFVGGSNNIVLVTDNSIVSRTAVSVSGNNNKIIGNVKGSVAISGNGNCLDATVSGQVTVTGIDNDVGGICGTLSKGSGTGNSYRKLKNGSARGVLTATTDSAGQLLITHGLVSAATSIKAIIQSTTAPLVVTSANPGNSATTSLLKVWNLNGTAAAYTSVTVEWEAEI